MPKRIKIPILGENFPSQSRVQSVQELYNFYLEEDKTQDRFIAYGFPGYEEWVDMSGSVVRGMLEHRGVGYAVIDNILYSITDKNTQTNLGTLSTSTGKVQMAAINDEIGVVDGTSFYHYKISTTTFSTPADADIPSSPTVLTAIGEYFVIPEPDDKKLFVSDLADGTSWNALSFVSADTRPDNIVGCSVANTLLYAMCEYSTEIFYISGGDVVPLDRAVAGSYDIGTPAKHSPAVVNNTMYWLGQNKGGSVGVVRSNGGSPELISNRAMTQKIGTYDTISDAFGWTYQENGHPFYMITFPSVETINGQTIGRTWAFDLSTRVWSEVGSKRTNAVSPPQLSRHTANCSLFLNNEHLIGDYLSGKIFKLSDTVYTEDGDEIIRTIKTSHIVDTDLPVSMSDLVVETESGVGLDGSGQGTDPEIGMRFSKDRGRTWSNQLTRKTGKLGEYNTRAKWSRIGTGRSITLEFTMSDPIKWVILGATALMDIEDA